MANSTTGWNDEDCNRTGHVFVADYLNHRNQRFRLPTTLGPRLRPRARRSMP